MSLILLVEGPTDQHVCRNLLREHDVSVDVKPCDGIDNLLDTVMPVTLRSASHRSIGVIIDADVDVAARWKALSHRLKAAGYDPPPAPDPDGTIVSGDRTVGVWLMPDNTIAGTLEHFVAMLIPAGDELWPVSRGAVAAIPQNLRRFAPGRMAKAELHTYLAWQEEPGTQLGAAITKRYFQSNHAVAARFVAWVNRLRELGQD